VDMLDTSSYDAVLVATGGDNESFGARKTGSGMFCCKCNVELELKEVTFKYMGFHFNYPLPKCPSCGQVYISEELVNGKVKEVEILLEGK